jgi:nucleoside-diphosphate-sugar epimerase
MRILVTGGGGFLGTAICRQLCARGNQVLSFSRQRYPWLERLRVEQVAGDIAALDGLMTASRGCDAIVHVAAKAGAWGKLEDYYETNVRGTDHVLAACAMNGITRLVYTSTPSVVHAGGDLEGVNESVPYAERFHAHYPATKKLAEQRVLAANSPELATVALRPHLIWGPGDNHLLPRLLARRRTGRLRFIGRERKRVDVTYVDNAAAAHVAALDRLTPGAPCAGKAYFISQGEPVFLDDMVNKLLHACREPTETRRIPYGLAYGAGLVLEALYGLLRSEREPPLTRFVVEQLATAHWYDITAARRDLGYVPTVSTQEGLLKLAQWYEQEGRKAY